MDKSPDAFRTISEVAEDLDLPQHVLRFWETRFSQIRPLKRGGGRRYYRPDDVDLLKGIRHLLYGQGYTIKGVQRILKEEGARFVQSVGRGEQQVAAPPEGRAEHDHAGLGPLAGYDPAPPAQYHGLEVTSDPARPPETAYHAPLRSYLKAADLDLLRRALDELSECARVLAALKLPAEPLASE